MAPCHMFLAAKRVRQFSRHLPPFRSAMTSSKLNVVPVRVNADNYAYLIQTAADEAAAVDPCEPDKLMKVAKQRGWRITSVLTTHHHLDHSGGNEDMVRLLADPSLKVYGGDDRIPALNAKVQDKAAFTLGKLNVVPYFTVCHTRGSVSYFVTSPSTSDKAIFTGDTLFVAGCGRFFEGTPQEMHTSLNTILGALPDDTQVYCGHEYTASNLRFAASVEPDNKEILDKLEWAKATECTVPSSIGEEKRINPFMRVGVAAVQKAAGGLTDAVEVMGKLRELKNNFR
ncbi:hydroxyacylglutathione hydrolase [Chytriomyces sp. MP71]|nr:hydroxyacylglutathione hydrolase [Chytriomyces sp. MP71]